MASGAARARTDGAEARRDVVVVPGGTSRAAEVFRRLLTIPLFSAPLPRIVLVTSTGIGEGKTVASVNLAATLAEAGARVLLIDANLWRPRCHALLGVSNARGLATYLAGDADIATLVHHLDVPRFSFLPAGAAAESRPASSALATYGAAGEAAPQSRLPDPGRAADLSFSDPPARARADAIVLVVRARATPPPSWRACGIVSERRGRGSPG